MKKVTGIQIAGLDFRVVEDDEMARDKFALVNENGRGVACDLNTSEITDHIGHPFPAPHLDTTQE